MLLMSLIKSGPILMVLEGRWAQLQVMSRADVDHADDARRQAGDPAI